MCSLVHSDGFSLSYFFPIDFEQWANLRSHITVSSLGIKGLLKNLVQYIKAPCQGFLTAGDLVPQCMETVLVATMGEVATSI